MGELASLFGQLTPVKYPSLSPVASPKSSLVVPVVVRCGLRCILFDAAVCFIQQLKLFISPNQTCLVRILVWVFFGCICIQPAFFNDNASVSASVSLPKTSNLKLQGKSLTLSSSEL